jgi:hypothetical protein
MGRAGSGEAEGRPGTSPVAGMLSAGIGAASRLADELAIHER